MSWCLSVFINNYVFSFSHKRYGVPEVSLYMLALGLIMCGHDIYFFTVKQMTPTCTSLLHGEFSTGLSVQNWILKDVL